MDKKTLALDLYEIGAVKFGDFTLKSGIQSPIYIDLRLVVSYPGILNSIADAVWEKLKGLPKDCICGVPYTALPIATALSLTRAVPMVMRRKEVKEYGTRRAIEGAFLRGDRCAIIEDLATSGASILETIEPLEAEGLKVTDAVVLIDREQGGSARLRAHGYTLHSVFTLSEMLQILHAAGKISSQIVQEVARFIEKNQLATR